MDRSRNLSPGPLSRRQAGRTQSRPPPPPHETDSVHPASSWGAQRRKESDQGVFSVPVHPGRTTVGWTGTSCDPRSQPLAGHPLQAHWSPSSGSCSFLSPLRGPVGQCGVRWGPVGSVGSCAVMWGPMGSCGVLWKFWSSVVYCGLLHCFFTGHTQSRGSGWGEGRGKVLSTNARQPWSHLDGDSHLPGAVGVR